MGNRHPHWIVVLISIFSGLVKIVVGPILCVLVIVIGFSLALVVFLFGFFFSRNDEIVTCSNIKYEEQHITCSNIKYYMFIHLNYIILKYIEIGSF